MTTDVIIYIAGTVGRLRLNRPRALHALNAGMCESLLAALEKWRSDTAVVAVILDHAPAPDGDPKLSRGFCAGGDIRLIADSGAGDGEAARAFFHLEYRLNHALFTYAKPTIAFMDGVTMGGGVGIAMPCRYRVATENTRFAMPESGIGLFPDVGGGWYLSRLPGRVGAFLAVTGHRLNGADCAALGLATHYIPADRLDDAKSAIIADPQTIAATLGGLSGMPDAAGTIVAHRADIDRLFASGRLEDIVAALEADGGDFARAQLAVIRTKSPLAMKVGLRIVHEGASTEIFADEMAREYAVAGRMVQRHDFLEGVRAVIVDKDHAPRWDPATPKGVTDHVLDQIFAPLPSAEAWTPHD